MRLGSILKTAGFHIRCAIERPGFKPYTRKREIMGVPIEFLVGDIESAVWERSARQSGDSADDRELEFIGSRMLQPGDTVFDCGGHHGKTGIFFSKLVGPSGKVVVFEPRPVNVRIIEQNVARNEAGNVTVERMALGDRQSKLVLRDRSNGSITWKPSQKGIEVNVTTIDRYAASRCLRPAFIKIDVEGFEYHVLKGATDTLATNPKLAIEIHASAIRRYGEGLPGLLRLLPAADYDLWTLGETGLATRFAGTLPAADRFHLFAIPTSRPATTCEARPNSRTVVGPKS